MRYFLRIPVKITVQVLAAGCQLSYRKFYGFFYSLETRTFYAVFYYAPMTTVRGRFGLPLSVGLPFSPSVTTKESLCNQLLAQFSSNQFELCTNVTSILRCECDFEDEKKILFTNSLYLRL